ISADQVRLHRIGSGSRIANKNPKLVTGDHIAGAGQANLIMIGSVQNANTGATLDIVRIFRRGPIREQADRIGLDRIAGGGSTMNDNADLVGGNQIARPGGADLIVLGSVLNQYSLGQILYGMQPGNVGTDVIVFDDIVFYWPRDENR